MKLQKKIPSEIKLKTSRLGMKFKPKKMTKVPNFLNINENNTNFSKFDLYNTTNKLYYKTISHSSTITKANTNSSSQKDLMNVRQKLNKCFDINIDINDNNNFLYRSKSKNNIYRNNSIFTEDFKNEKKMIYSSYQQYKKANFNHLFLKNLKEITNFKNTKNNGILRKNYFKNSNLKTNLINYNTDNVNMLLNHYPTIEKHRKIKFNQEIKHIIKDIKMDIYNQNKNKKIICGYSQKNIMIPYKLIPKNTFTCNSQMMDDENIYKLNILTKSKVFDINDLHKKNNYFNYEKLENIKRSSSLENLNFITNSKSPKYISDHFCNKKISKPEIKIEKYKSKKLHEIYYSLKN